MQGHKDAGIIYREEHAAWEWAVAGGAGVAHMRADESNRSAKNSMRRNFPQALGARQRRCASPFAPSLVRPPPTARTYVQHRGAETPGEAIAAEADEESAYYDIMRGVDSRARGTGRRVCKITFLYFSEIKI